MKQKIQFNDVGITLNDQTIFEHFSYTLESGKDVCLIGKVNCGKTLLLKAVHGNIDYQGSIEKSVSCEFLFQILKSNECIEDLLNFYHLTKSDQKVIKDYLKLTDLSYHVNDLNLKYQWMVTILYHVLQKPTFFFVDDVLSYFSKDDKINFIQLLHHYDITLFYVTSNVEDVLLFSNCIVMGSGGVLMEGKTLTLLTEEKILKRLGFSLPFFVDLSLQLKSYGLIDQIFLSEQELTKALWK